MVTRVYIDGNEIASIMNEFTVEEPAIDPCSTATLLLQTHPPLVPPEINYRVGDPALNYHLDYLTAI